MKRGKTPDFRQQHLDSMRKQMKEMGVMMDSFLKGNPIVDRIIRDHFAGQCAAAACWAGENFAPKVIAFRAYEVADAMMKERAKGWPSQIIGADESWTVTLKCPMQAAFLPSEMVSKYFRVIAKTRKDAISKIRFHYTNEIESVEPLDPKSHPLVI